LNPLTPARAAAPAIAFRRFDAADFQQVFLWLLRPHVARGYARPPGSFTEFVAKYGARTRADNPVQAYVVTVDGADAGYIQTYSIAEFPEYAAQLGCDEKAAGVDLFIGEPAFLHRGIGSQVLRRFVAEIVFGRNAASCCVAGPAEGELGSIRAFENAGFRAWKSVKMPDAHTEHVMRCEPGAT